MIRLIGLDLDGTTLRSDKSLSEHTREVLERAIAAGVHVAVASGRPYCSLPACLWDVRGLEYAVCSNGASVWHLGGNRQIFHDGLSAEAVSLMIQVSREMNLLMEAYINGEAYAPVIYLEDPVQYGCPSGSASYFQTTRHPVEDIRAFMREHIDELDCLDFLIGSQEQQTNVREALSKLSGIYVTSSVPHLVEVASPKAGKANALSWLAGNLGIRRSEVLACGNAENDMDMILWAGVGAAVSDSPEEVKAAADIVIADCDHDGVAEVIEEWVL